MSDSDAHFQNAAAFRVSDNPPKLWQCHAMGDGRTIACRLAMRYPSHRASCGLCPVFAFWPGG